MEDRDEREDLDRVEDRLEEDLEVPRPLDR